MSVQGRRGRSIAPGVLLLISLLAGACGPSAGDLYNGSLPDRVDFNLHIKPILSDRCFACHGPDEKAREAELRLDIEDEARRVLSHSLLRRSELVRRITADDPEEVMPPPESNLKLSEYEIGLLVRWIEQGAEWKPHWSFIPPEKPPVPEVSDSLWSENPIDFFVLARLERERLRPSAEAAKERLIRRVTYDLTGLPPTLDELDEFLADASPGAYERVVDRLLASPAYGERMASEWLDVARYADSNGYQADGSRRMWPWRDWVIEAFNENLPYDKFVTWQLAGDLLPEATKEQILATGFNRNHPQNSEGGSIDEEFRVEYVADRTNTFGQAFLGLTMECARCHDHKYDPISQSEYYRLFAFFNSNNEIGMAPIDGNGGPTLLLLDSETERRIAEARNLIIEKERSLRAYEKRVEEDGKHVERLRSHRFGAPPGLVGHYPLDAISEGEVANTVNRRHPGWIGGNVAIVEGKVSSAVQINEAGVVGISKAYAFERTDPFSLSAWIYPVEEREDSPIILKVGSHGTFYRGYDLYLRGDKVVASLTHKRPHNRIQVASVDSLPFSAWSHVAMTYDGSSRAGGLRIYINGKRAQVAVEADSLYNTIVDGSAILLGQRLFGGSFAQGRIDEVRIYDRMLTSIEVAEIAGQYTLRSLLDQSEWSRWERDDLLELYLHRVDGEYGQRLAELKAIRARENPLLPGIEDAMVMEELDEPRPTHVLDRGLYDAPTDRVEPGTPEAVLAFADSLSPNRLGLARWLFSSENPLTARVAVNRYWQLLFGTGLVKTSEDFGSQGQPPSHPELLDWLAVRFRESGWDVKALLKTIVTSSTYRQSSGSTDEMHERDPENRLLARGPSYRLPAEMIRDGALAASGLLVRQVGGPSVKPYQPEGLWKEKGTMLTELYEYAQDEGDDLYRRSLYTFWKRTSPPPMMDTFDAAHRTRSVVRRQRTSTPLQSLVLMNDPQFVEAARMLAERMARIGGSDAAIRFGFRTVTSRMPSPEELDVLISLFEKELAGFHADRESASQLVSVGEHERDETLDAARVAAMTVVANTLLNLDETITKR